MIHAFRESVGHSVTVTSLSVDWFIIMQEVSIIFRPPPPNGPELPHFRSIIIILRHTTVGRTPLDE